MAFSAPPKDPKTRSAPQENPLRRKNGPRHGSRKKNWAFFVSTPKLFANFSRPRLAHERRHGPNAITAETKRFAISDPGPKTADPRETAEREELIRSPNSHKNGFWFRCVRSTRPKMARKRNFSATFSDLQKKRRNPYFCSVSKIFQISGLLISSPRAPYQLTGSTKTGPLSSHQDIYIYMCAKQ